MDNEIEDRDEFERVLGLFKWKPIFNCPGRYILRQCSKETFKNYYSKLTHLEDIKSPKIKDPTFLYRFESGGLISYRKDNGDFIHTLCNKEGLSRKLEELEG